MIKVSVLLPVYNGSRFIKNAIQSVQSQSFSDWELIVIDDASTDETAHIVRLAQKQDARIVYIENEKNLGIQKTLNKGLVMAHGEYIARIDDDDIWCEPDKLEKQIAFLSEHENYALVGTGAIVVNEQGKEISRFLNPGTDMRIRSLILGKNCFTHSSVVFRKDALLKFNGYNEKINVLHVEDYDAWLRVGLEYRFANLSMYGVKWMLRESGLGSKNKLVQFKNGMQCSRGYAHAYPNALWGYIRHAIRYAAYAIFLLIPVGFLRRFTLDIFVRLFGRAL